jgi:hypothetical protein
VKKKEKILIILLLGIVLIMAILAIVKNQKESQKNIVEGINEEEEFTRILEDGTKLNVSTKLNETKMVDKLKIYNIQLTSKNDQTVFLADVESSEDKEITLVDIVLLNKNGNELTTITGLIGKTKAGGVQQLNCVVTSDYANAYDFKVIVK